MNTFAELPADVKAEVSANIRTMFGPYAEVNANDQIQIMYKNQGDYVYQPIHGYVVIDTAKTESSYSKVLICEGTPDEGGFVVHVKIF